MCVRRYENLHLVEAGLLPASENLTSDWYFVDYGEGCFH